MFKFLTDRRELFLSVLRITAGFLYFTHGASKLLGWFGGFGDGGTAPLMSRFGAAGVIETLGGVLLMLGVQSRLVAFICSGQMAVAYFWIHMQRGLWPWANGGELAALYSFVFLYLAAAGPGSIALQKK